MRNLRPLFLLLSAALALCAGAGAVHAQDALRGGTPAASRAGALSPLDFGAVCDGKTRALSTVYPTLPAAQVAHPHATSLANELDWAGIQAAVTAAAAREPRGTVLLPNGNCLTNVTIRMVYGVSVIGHGGTASVITATGVDAFSTQFTAGFGNTLFRDFGIEGNGATAKTALNFPGTSRSTDELYGVTINRVLVRRFDTCIHLKTVRTFEISSNWCQDVRKGISSHGLTLAGKIFGNTIVLGSATQAGSVGIELYPFTYPVGGQQPNEGMDISHNSIFGQDTGIVVNFVNYTNLVSNDISARVYGIDFETGQNGLNIKDNYIEMASARARAGIYGRGLNTPIQAIVNIEGNTLIGAALGSSRAITSGIQIHSENRYQDHVNIVRNLFTGFTLNDVRVSAAGPMNITNNRGLSSDATHCILVDSVVLPIVFVDRNHCRKAISVSRADVNAGRLVLGTNVHNDTALLGASYQGQAAFDPPRLPVGAAATTTVSVGGAALGDYVEGVSFSVDLQGITVSAYVAAANTVAVRFHNETAAAIDLASGTLRVKVKQKDLGT